MNRKPSPLVQPDVWLTILLGATMILTALYSNTRPLPHSPGWLFRHPGPARPPLSSPALEEQNAEPSGYVEQGERVIRITVIHLHLEPGMVVVQRGEQVRLEIVSTDDLIFRLPGYHIQQPLAPYRMEPIRFEATRAGMHLFCCAGERSRTPSRVRGRLLVLNKPEKNWQPRTAMQGVAAFLRKEVS